MPDINDNHQDPTELTTRLIRREMASHQQIIETRLNGMDKATELLNANVTRVPTETDKAISHLKELHDEKFWKRAEAICGARCED
jgi:hypothetical protein